MKDNAYIIKKMFRGSLMVMILATLTATLGMVIDGILIGSYLGVDAMASYGIAGPAFIVISAIGGIISSVEQTLCAREMGRGKMDEAIAVFSLSTVFGVAISLVFTFALLLFSNPLAVLLGASGNHSDLLPDASMYMKGLAFGIPAMTLTGSLQPIMQLDGDKPKALLSVIVMTVVNIGSDLLNIFVFHGGMLGMAIATTVSYYAGLVVFVIHFFRKDSMYRLRFDTLKADYLPEIITIGLPTAVSRVCNMVRTLLLNRLLLTVAGSMAVAAFSVQSNMNNMFGSVAVGVGMTTLMISGVVVGEEDKASIKKLIKTSLAHGFVLVTIVSVILFIFAPLFVSLYVQNSPETAALAVASVRFFCISMPLHATIGVFINYLQGSRNTLRAHILTLFNELVFIVAAAFVLSPVFSVNGVWASFPVGKVLTILLLIGMAAVNVKRYPNRLEDFLFLPENFDVPDSEKYEAHACDMEQVLVMSREALEFCRQKGIEEKRAYYLSLCIEEMAGNIIKFGFSDGKKHDIDLRLIRKEDELIVRIRDDCRLFNPKEWLEIHSEDEKTKNIGIRMINQIAKDFNYINTLDMNNLIIRI